MWESIMIPRQRNILALSRNVGSEFYDTRVKKSDKTCLCVYGCFDPAKHEKGAVFLRKTSGFRMFGGF